MGIQLHVMLLVLVELCSYCQVCVYVCVLWDVGLWLLHAQKLFFSFSFFFFFFLWWRKEVDKIV